MAYPKQVVRLATQGKFTEYVLCDVNDKVVSFKMPSDMSGGAGTYTIRVAMGSADDRDDAARVALVNHGHKGDVTQQAGFVAAVGDLHHVKPDPMSQVLIKTLDFLCLAALEGVGQVSGLSVLCSVKGTKEQVFRALKLLTLYNPNMLVPHDAPVSKTACPVAIAQATPADELYEVTDFLWAMDRLQMLYKLVQVSS